tara:strand:+ start:5319 stop:5552 length:234 start_codon:yes stop_codon:yes gene_type:complete
VTAFSSRATTQHWAFATLRQLDKDAPEDAHLAPPDEAIVNGLVWPVAWRDIAPPQTIADHKNDAAYIPTIIDTRHPV